MNKLVLYKIRPINLFISWIAILSVSFLCNELNSAKLIYTFVTISCFLMASNLLNDVLDIKTDIINKSKETLIFKSINLKILYLIIFLLYGIGVWASFFLFYVSNIVAITIILPLLIFYTKIFKKIALIGNFIIAGITASVFPFTEAALTSQVSIMWVPFLLAFILSTIRELCKDIEDMEGDSINNITTFPVKFGKLNAIYLLRSISIIFYFFSISLWIIDYYQYIYLLLLIIGVLLPLHYGVFFMINKQSKKNSFTSLSKLLKSITLIGVIIILISELKINI